MQIQYLNLTYSEALKITNTFNTLQNARLSIDTFSELTDLIFSLSLITTTLNVYSTPFSIKHYFIFIDAIANNKICVHTPEQLLDELATYNALLSEFKIGLCWEVTEQILSALYKER